MPNVGPLELVVVLIIALVIFGPKRLPELGRSMGKGIREFRSSVTGKDEDEDEPSKPAEIEGAQDADEPVEGEVVTHHRS
ncbi:MAG TPA: twin-arginine translocase TatA/TatE family subunit [Solirubrobacterales bacterium]|nr:twin-arginine translocase TatA/TatE family subunit [Solirubrobacterales bacterium]